MEYQKRWYQEEAVEETFKIVKTEKDKHPIIVAPTGTGKTAIMCKLIDMILTDDVTKNVLVLSHDERILGQNYAGLEGFFECIPIGLYSSGLKSRTIKKITVAGIQSVFRRPEEFIDFSVVIIDECHMINTRDAGMYRKFLKELDAVYIGLTATHFRTNYGYIHEGEDALFNHISYDMSSPEIFNRIIAEGYLAPLYSKNTALKLNTDGIKKVAGDFDKKQMSDRFNKEEIIEAAIVECQYYGKKYKHWLVFAIDIENAEYISRILNKRGITAVAIHSKAGDTKQKINDFKSGKYRAAVQVNMLTTGFDFPAIDMIIDLRPTSSPIVHIQGKGRGLRPVYADGYDLDTVSGRLEAIKEGGKPHCLVLDFAGNTRNLGPINYPNIKQKGNSKGKGEAVTKTCGVCDFINWGGAKVCENCGNPFKFKERLELTASDEEIILKEEIKKKNIDGPTVGLIEWHPVSGVTYSRHQNRIGKQSLKVTYKCGMRDFNEWLPIEGHGYAKYKSKSWIDFRWTDFGNDSPSTIDSFLENTAKIKIPLKVLIDDTGKYPNIQEYEF